jgi:hypothetical protein
MIMKTINDNSINVVVVSQLCRPSGVTLVSLFQITGLINVISNVNKDNHEDYDMFGQCCMFQDILPSGWY